MTMFLSVDLHEYVFVAADRQVSIGKNVTNMRQVHQELKLVQTINSVCTGCGLQPVIKSISDYFINGNINKRLLDNFKEQYPTELLNMTKVIVIPKSSRVSERIMSIELHEKSLTPIQFIGGTVQGS